MLNVTTIIKGVNTKSPAIKRAMSQAQDSGLSFYREKYLPLHFKAVHARLRYGAAYSKRGKRSRGPQKRSTEKRKRENAGKVNKDRGNKRPLFRSGLLESKVLAGGVKFTGRWDRRKIKYNPPFYLYISQAGQINKLDALSARTSKEDQKVIEFVGEEFLKNLESDQITLRST